MRQEVRSRHALLAAGEQLSQAVTRTPCNPRCSQRSPLNALWVVDLGCLARISRALPRPTSNGYCNCRPITTFEARSSPSLTAVSSFFEDDSFAFTFLNMAVLERERVSHRAGRRFTSQVFLCLQIIMQACEQLESSTHMGTASSQRHFPPSTVTPAKGLRGCLTLLEGENLILHNQLAQTTA